jgi:uncharacterized protein YfaS (alpha-2-macroglobulin family)
VTARNTSTGDAVERELRVHPNGQEISFSTSQLIAGTQNAVKVRVPEAAIGGSIEAELRIYPSLMAHVLDAIDGIGMRPAGCAEQVTSTAYVSLMALELLKKVGQDKPGRDNPRSAIAAKALAAVQEAYRKLAETQNADGGFGYWYTWSGNSALTAYVMRFVTEAKEFIPVDENVARRARNYLVAHQVRPGTWGVFNRELKKEVEDVNTTMYVARALAGIDSQPADKKDSKEEKDKEKLRYMNSKRESIRGTTHTWWGTMRWLQWRAGEANTSRERGHYWDNWRIAKATRCIGAWKQTLRRSTDGDSREGWRRPRWPWKR